MKKSLFVFLFVFLTPYLSAGPLEEALAAYTQAEQAESFQERERLFNRALNYYSQVDQVDAKLYFNLGNCYYQLGQMGMALWHYHKAQALDPRNAKIDENLKKALDRAQLKPSAMEGVFNHLFFFHTQMLAQEKLLLFYIFVLLFFISASLWIWFSQKVFQTFTWVALCLLGLFSISFYLDHHKKPSTAILIQPAWIRCDAGAHYQEIEEGMALEGEKVKILKISPDGAWMKVKLSSKKEGYLPSKKVRAL